MNYGKIIETGTHAELLARGGEYAKLYRLQFSETGRGAGPADDSRAKEATVHSASNEGDDI
jgi:hypothetical protein